MAKESQSHDVVVWETESIVPTYRVLTLRTKGGAIARAKEALKKGAVRAAVVDMTQRTRRGAGKTVWDSREENA